MGPFQRPLHYAVDGNMAGVAASTLNTAETVAAQSIDFHMAMLTMVWATDRNTQAETGGYSVDTIIHPEADGRDEDL